MIRKISSEIITALLVLLFVYAAVSKLLYYDLFRFQLGKSQYTYSYASIIAWALPLLELSITALLIVRRTHFLGLCLSLFMMILFTGYVFAILHFSDHIPCSCGGIISKLSWSGHLIFNAFFTLLALAGLLINSNITKDEISKEVEDDLKSFREKKGMTLNTLRKK